MPGARVAITGRNPDRVRALAKICGAEAALREQALKHAFRRPGARHSAGHVPHVDECFFDGDIPAEIVFDMVYNPLETMLIRRAREQGKTVVCGLEMFIEQAVRQFEIWTGETAPRAADGESRARSARSQ